MVLKDNFRLGKRTQQFLTDNLQTTVFLFCYFITVILGQLILISPWADEALHVAALPAAKILYPSRFTTDYWVFLLLPFVVVPAAAIVVKRYIKHPIRKFSTVLPEFRTLDYFFLLTCSYGFEIFSFFSAGAGLLSFSSQGGVSARFELLNRLGFVPLMVLYSVLSLLGIYSLILALTKKTKLWIITAIFNAVSLSIFFILLNMKWPIVVFYSALAITVFLYSSKAPLWKAAISFLLIVASFLAITLFVWRGGEPTAAAPTDISQLDQSSSVSDAKIQDGEKDASGIKASNPNSTSDQKNLISWASKVLVFASLRMANPSVYFESYNSQGPVCGGLIEQISIGPDCRPSTYIYSEIFGKDGFEGIGTSPATSHITAYALGGWPLSLLTLLMVAIFLSVLSCLDIASKPIVGAISIMGAISAYHFSQLPFEGPLIYDHGILWTGLFLFCYWLYRYLSSKFKIYGNKF